MTNEFKVKIEEFVCMIALMCDSEMIDSLEGVGVPEDLIEKFESLQKNFGKCMIVGKPHEVDASNFESLQAKVTYDKEKFDELDAIELTQAIAGNRYKLKTIATELSLEKQALETSVNSFNAKAGDRSNMLLQWGFIKLILVLFLRCPEVALESIEGIKEKLSKSTNQDVETRLFRDNTPKACYNTCVEGCI